MGIIIFIYLFAFTYVLNINGSQEGKFSEWNCKKCSPNLN